MKKVMRKEVKEMNKYFNGIGKVGIVLLFGFIFNMNPKAFAEVTFGTNIRVDDTDSSTSVQYGPSIAVDINGNICVAWKDERNGNSDIYFTKSTDGGNSFGTNVRVDDTGSSTSVQYYPSIAVDINGNIYVAWKDDRNGNSDIYFTKSTDGGNSFGTNVRVSDVGSSTGWPWEPSIAVDINGNIYVVWEDNRNGNYDIYFAKSTDGGNSFGTNVRVDDTGPSTSGQYYPSIAVDTNGSTYIVWFDERNGNSDIYFTKSTDGGNSFGTNVRVDDTGSSTNDQRWSSIAVDTNGNIYVAWDDERNDDSDDIYFAKSTDGGSSFGTNVRVDDTGSSTSGQWEPSIAVDTNGNICVAWEDDRNGNSDIYFTKSTDGGNSFGTNVRVDDTGSSTSDQFLASIAVDTNGNIYVAWHDYRNGNSDIYFACTFYGDNYVDLGNPTDEVGHNLIRWDEVFTWETAPSGDTTARCMRIGEDNYLNLCVLQTNVSYLLTAEVVDGECDDSFKIYVNGNEKYSYTSDPCDGITIETHKIGIPAEDITSSCVLINFESTANDLGCPNTVHEYGRAPVYNVELTPSRIFPYEAAELAKEVIEADYLWGGKGYNFNEGRFVESNDVKDIGYYYWNPTEQKVDFGSGLDCSGLSFWAYNRAYLKNETVSWKECIGKCSKCPIAYEGADGQYRGNCKPIEKHDLLPGDLLFYNPSGDKMKILKHVMMYVGPFMYDSTEYNVIHAEGVSTEKITPATYNPETEEVITPGAETLEVTAYGRVGGVRLDMLIEGGSPIDLVVVDPNGLIITRELGEVPGMYYSEYDIDDDGELDNIVAIPTRKIGNYSIEVVPEPNASPTDTYSLEATIDNQTMIIAEDVQIQDIPEDPYEVESKLCYSDFDDDNDVDFVDYAIFASHWFEQDCNYPAWCEGTDLDYGGSVDFNDLVIFTEHWLWPSQGEEPEEPETGGPPPQDPNITYSIVDANGDSQITLDVNESITLYVDIVTANDVNGVWAFHVEVDISDTNLGSVDNTECPNGTALILAGPNRDTWWDYWGPGLEQEEGIQLFGLTNGCAIADGNLASFVFTCNGEGPVTLELLDLGSWNIDNELVYPKTDDMFINQGEQMQGEGMSMPAQTELSQEEIDEIVSWLEDLWSQEKAVREICSRPEWNEFIDSVKDFPLY